MSFFQENNEKIMKKLRHLFLLVEPSLKKPAKDCWEGFDLFKMWSAVCITLEMAKLQSVYLILRKFISCCDNQ